MCGQIHQQLELGRFGNVHPKVSRQFFFLVLSVQNFDEHVGHELRREEISRSHRPQWQIGLKKVAQRNISDPERIEQKLSEEDRNVRDDQEFEHRRQEGEASTHTTTPEIPTAVVKSACWTVESHPLITRSEVSLVGAYSAASIQN